MAYNSVINHSIVSTPTFEPMCNSTPVSKHTGQVTLPEHFATFSVWQTHRLFSKFETGTHQTGDIANRRKLETRGQVENMRSTCSSPFANPPYRNQPNFPPLLYFQFHQPQTHDWESVNLRNLHNLPTGAPPVYGIGKCTFSKGKVMIFGISWKKLNNWRTTPNIRPTDKGRSFWKCVRFSPLKVGKFLRKSTQKKGVGRPGFTRFRFVISDDTWQTAVTGARFNLKFPVNHYCCRSCGWGFRFAVWGSSPQNFQSVFGRLVR